MVLVILRAKNSELKIEEISSNDYNSMKTALIWKKTGNWERIKKYIYKNNLHKKKSRFR